MSARIIIGVCYLFGYVALDYLSFVRPYHGLGITPWNPSSGLSLALAFFAGAQSAPLLFIAPGLAELLVRSGETNGLLVAAASLTLGPSYLAAGLLLQRVSINAQLDSLRDVLTVIAVSVAAACVAALAYALVLALAGAIALAEFREVIWRSFIGNLIGTLVVGSALLLAWRRRDRFYPMTMVNVTQLISILAALVVIFGYREATAFQLFYLLFLPLLWIALSHGVAGAVAALVFIQIGLVIGAEIRFGPDPGLIALQVLLVALAITGLIVGAIVSERAITAQRLREQQDALSRAFRLRSAGEVAATISHEINQPLTAIMTYSGIALSACDRGDWSLAADTVRKVVAESGRANRVLRSIRDMLTHGSLAKSKFNVASILNEVSEVLADDLAKKRVSLRIAVADEAATAYADATQVQQAVHNLIVNGAEAIVGSGQGGTVEIDVKRLRRGVLVIDVNDDGPGFAPGLDLGMPAPFITTKPEGSGLGLVVARSIAEAHGGSLTISTRKRGATVRLTLPILKETDGSNSSNN